MSAREAELELENMRLREALEEIERHAIKPWAGIATRALCVPHGTPSLSAIIEKVERATIERCVKHLDDKEVEQTNYCMHVYEEGEQYKSEAIAEIRALPTGQIKLEDLM